MTATRINAHSPTVRKKKIKTRQKRQNHSLEGLRLSLETAHNDLLWAPGGVKMLPYAEWPVAAILLESQIIYCPCILILKTKVACAVHSGWISAPKHHHVLARQ